MSLNQQDTSANFTMTSEINSSHWMNQDQLDNMAIPNINHQIPQWPEQRTWTPMHTNMGMIQSQMNQSVMRHYQPFWSSIPTQSPSNNPYQLQVPQMQLYQHAAPSPVTNQFLKSHCPSSTSKLHQARISLVPAASGGFKAVVKRKRKRTMFTTEQVEALESVFVKKPYITREDREVLSDQLQINDTSIKVWFQNRRLKGKRETEQAAEMVNEDYEESFPREESFYSDTNSGSLSSEQSIEMKTFTSLDRIEAELNLKADGSGYVTLDDNILMDIVGVIDTVLSADVDLSALSNSLNPNKTEDMSESEGSTYEGSIYEPISPAESENIENEEPRWQPSEPGKSLQRLFDLHFC